jgi:cytochrome c peroxidase
MHNGSIRTLRDVLTFYELLMDAVSETIEGGDKATDPPLDPLLKQLNLSAEDFPALEAFLKSLEADNYEKSVPVSVPSGLQVAGF